MLRTFASLSVAALLAGCGINSDYTGNYVGTVGDGLIRLSLVEADDSRINATMSIAEIDQKSGKIETTTGGMTGIRNGKAINLIAANGSGGSMSLIASGGKLVWQVPDTGQSVELLQTSEAEYQKRLIQLSQQLHRNDVGIDND